MPQEDEGRVDEQNVENHPDQQPPADMTTPGESGAKVDEQADQNAREQGVADDGVADDAVADDAISDDAVADEVEEQVDAFPVVGIGGSAGSLDPLRTFLNNLPPDTGMAFVIIQHMLPTGESALHELLVRWTPMPVHRVAEGMPVEPDTIYVNLPDRDVTLSDGCFRLRPRDQAGLHLPIDLFLRSLAYDRRNKAVAILLSGTGSDGTLGVQTIKGAGGMVMVQDPATATHDNMLYSVIATKLVDSVLAPEDMSDQLLSYAQMQLLRPSMETKLALEDEQALQTVLKAIRDEIGHDLSAYRRNTIIRRIQRRMAVHRIDRFPDYAQYLRHHPSEARSLFRELLIGVTSFFRDSEVFDVLEREGIPQLLVDHAPDDPVRVWVAGCSTGEEAYSMAILFREAMDNLDRQFELQVFATDLDEDGINRARNGIYPVSIAGDVSPDRLRRWFVREGDVLHVAQTIRDNVVFAVHNLIKDPPFSHMDLVSCRNLLIYLSAEMQRKVVPIFHYALKPGGLLLLGTAESLGEHSHLFEPLDNRAKLFRRKEQPSRMPIWDLGLFEHRPGREGATMRTGTKFALRETIEDMLLSMHTPPAVLVDERGQGLFFHGSTGRYLEPAPGEANLSLTRMAREGLRAPLSSSIRQAAREHKPVVHERVRVRTNGGDEFVRLTVKPIDAGASMKNLLLVLFEPLGHKTEPEPKAEIGEDERDAYDDASLREELRSARDHLQATVKELEESNQDLQAANEELQSSNEELQSTNEELQTSKEELQSVNEELVTVNAELNGKIEELTRAHSDMSNLLTSIQVGVIFLDRDGIVRRFTPAASRVAHLITTDVGRPIEHIGTSLVSENLAGTVQKVLADLSTLEKEVQTADGSWFVMHAMPYRTRENIVDGVILTFVDISEHKQAQLELERITQAVEQSLAMVLITDRRGRAEYVSPRFVDVTGYAEEQALGRTPVELNWYPPDGQDYDEMIAQVSEGNPWRGEFLAHTRTGESCWIAVSVAPVRDDAGEIRQFVWVADDVSGYKRMEEQLRHYSFMERTVIDMASSLLRTPQLEMNDAIAQSLAELADLADADRGYVALFDDDRRVRRFFEWHDEGLASWEQSRPHTGGWALDRLQDMDVLDVSRVSDLPPEVGSNRERWRAKGVLSLLEVPLMWEERLVGILGLSAECTERTWSAEDTRLVRLLGATLTGILVSKGLVDTEN